MNRQEIAGACCDVGDWKAASPWRKSGPGGEWGDGNPRGHVHGRAGHCPLSLEEAVSSGWRDRAPSVRVHVTQSPVSCSCCFILFFFLSVPSDPFFCFFFLHHFHSHQHHHRQPHISIMITSLHGPYHCIVVFAVTSVLATRHHHRPAHQCKHIIVSSRSSLYTMAFVIVIIIIVTTALITPFKSVLILFRAPCSAFYAHCLTPATKLPSHTIMPILPMTHLSLKEMR